MRRHEGGSEGMSALYEWPSTEALARGITYVLTSAGV